MIIREFRKDDVPYLHEIAYRSLDESYAPEIFDHFWSQWSSGQMVACRFDGVPVGFINSCKINDSARITMFAVDPQHRCRGIGTELMNAFKRMSMMYGLRTITLEVRNTNDRAISFYRRNGFIPSGLLENFYNDGGTAIKMTMYQLNI